MQCLRNSNDHDHECRFDPQDGDFCYAKLNTMENVWKKGFIVRKGIGVPDSHVVEVDRHKLCHNKCDLILRHPDDDGESDGHSDDHDVPMATELMPTLLPRPELKFPKLPVQATQQIDFNI